MMNDVKPRHSPLSVEFWVVMTVVNLLGGACLACAIWHCGRRGISDSVVSESVLVPVCCSTQARIITVKACGILGLRALILLMRVLCVQYEGQFGATGAIFASVNDLTDGDYEHSVHVYRFGDGNADVNVFRCPLITCLLITY